MAPAVQQPDGCGHFQGSKTMSRVIKKRRKKMRKHKYRKLRKRTRHQRRK